jgi:hypothetical protein
MVSNKIKRNHTKRRRQTKSNTKKKNAISRKNRMIGGMKRRIQYFDKTYNGAVWPELGMNIPHGKGTMTWDNGDVYDGNWKYGKMSGQGTMKWHNEVSYTGNWHSDKRNGFGTMRYANGKIAKGIWRDDYPTGDFEVTTPNPDPYRPPEITQISARELDEFIPEGDDESDADTEPD